MSKVKVLFILSVFALNSLTLTTSFNIKIINFLPLLKSYRCPDVKSLRLLHALTRCDVHVKKLKSTNPKLGIISSMINSTLKYFNTIVIGVLFSFLLRVLNSFKSHRENILIDEIFYRPRGTPLLTVSNHQSILDDPGLWACFLPWWRMRPEQMRWSMCTEDVFFAVKNDFLKVLMHFDVSLL